MSRFACSCRRCGVARQLHVAGHQLSSSSQNAAAQILASVSSVAGSGTPAGARLQYSAELREIALDALTLLLQLPGFTAELYVNYDASLFAPNLFEQLAEMLAKARRSIYCLTTVLITVHSITLPYTCKFIYTIVLALPYNTYSLGGASRLVSLITICWIVLLCSSVYNTYFTAYFIKSCLLLRFENNTPVQYNEFFNRFSHSSVDRLFLQDTLVFT